MAVDKRNGRRNELALVAGDWFDPPANLGSDALAMWDAYWNDRVSAVQTSVDRVIVIRWISELDRYFKLLRIADAEPLTTGGNGQLTANPAYGIATRSLSAVEYCEKQLGIGPLHRSVLGIAVVSEARSLADLNSAYGGGDGNKQPAESEVTASDPRIIEAG